MPPLAVLLAAALAAQELPPTPNDPAVQGPRPPSRESPTGNLVNDWVYGLSVDALGSEKTQQWLKRAVERLQTVTYRKYVIEQGYFLKSDDPRDPWLFVPLKPDEDPLVLFVKNEDILRKNGEELLAAIRRAAAKGDKELVKITADALFDAKYTEKLWTHDLAERRFGDGAFFYKIGTGGGGVRFQGGAGQAIALGGGQFLGGAVDVRGGGGVNFRKLEPVPKAQADGKLGAWGEFPGLPHTTWDVSAIQTWRLQDQRTSTELRAGGLHAFGDMTAGGFFYGRLDGDVAGPVQGRAVGGQLFFGPSPEIATALSAERDWPARGKPGGQIMLEVSRPLARVGRPPEAKDPRSIHDELFGDPSAAAAFLRVWGFRRADALLAELRRRALEKSEPGIAELLERARAVEAWSFDPKRDDGAPGWALSEVRPQEPDPAVEPLRLALASAARRAADARAAKSLELLLAVVQSRDDLSGLESVKTADAWRKRDDELEARRLWKRLGAVGAWWLAQLKRRPGWPENLSIEASADDWAPLLGLWGTRRLEAALGPAVARAAAGRATRARLGFLPTEGCRVRRLKDGELELVLGYPSELALRTLLERESEELKD